MNEEMKINLFLDNSISYIEMKPYRKLIVLNNKKDVSKVKATYNNDRYHIVCLKDWAFSYVKSYDNGDIKKYKTNDTLKSFANILKIKHIKDVIKSSFQEIFFEDWNYCKETRDIVNSLSETITLKYVQFNKQDDYYKQLQQAREEIAWLKIDLDEMKARYDEFKNKALNMCNCWDDFDKANEAEIEKLLKQNKIYREALKLINNSGKCVCVEDAQLALEKGEE